MPFNSPVFLFIFLPIVIAIYFIASHSLRNLVLLLASWVFYIWGEPLLFPLLLLTIGINFFIALSIGHRFESNQNPRRLVVLAILLNLLPLTLIKYGQFIAINLNILLGEMGLQLPFRLLQLTRTAYLNLPLGISFFTFQSISYILDVYRKVHPPERSLFNLALYLSLFPKLISGPLVRFKELKPQIESRSTSASDVGEGIRRFIFGLSKKILIANPLGALSFTIIRSPGNVLSPSVAWLAILAYTLQIYYDFSSYTDMAIGLGRIFGFRLPENFNYPYLSQSITEFWRRWHITLANWFRDYVFFPLERTHRRLVFDRYLNILIVFLLTGLWHGASWNFILWGLIQGLFIVFERSRAGAFLERAWRPLRHLYALLAIMFSWVFFRFPRIEGGLNFIRTLIGQGLHEGYGYPAMYLDLETMLILIFAIIFCLPVYPALQRICDRAQAAANRRLPPTAAFKLLTSGLAILLLAASVISLASSTVNAFIYFRF